MRQAADILEIVQLSPVHPSEFLCHVDKDLQAARQGFPQQYFGHKRFDVNCYVLAIRVQISVGKYPLKGRF